MLEGDFTISFSQLARIKNPFVAGNRVITVSSFAPGFRDDEITAVIRRTTTIDPSEGLRGTEFTLEGKGYQLGTVTVFEGPDDVINAGETLASVKTTRGAFSVKLNAAGEYGDPRYTVNTRDSYGVADQVDFSIKSSIYFEPASVNVGSKLRVTIFDWEDDYNEVVAVRIAGQAAHLPKAVSEFDNCYDYAGVYRPNSIGMVSLEVTVPTGVPPGEQTVSVYGQEQLDHRYDDGTNVPDPDKGPCANLPDAEMKGSATGRKVIVRLKNDPNPIVTATIEVESEPLVLSPSTAARGQRITIIGSGFLRASSGSGDFTDVYIDGWPVEEDPSRFEVGTDGDFPLTVRVPLEVRNGGNEVRVVGHDNTVAQAILTIPKATIALDPAQSGRGSEVKVSGSGFIVGRAVKFSYGDGTGLETGDDIVGVAVADAEGRISGTLGVPYTAAVGKVHVVTALSAHDGDSLPFVIEAEAEHTAVDATVTTLPPEVSHGDVIKVRGANLPAFTLVGPVELGGIGIAPRAETTTDENGSFEAEVRVPQLELGDQVLKVRVGSEVVIGVVKIVPPPLSGHPAEVFKELIREGILARIWHLESATQSWTFFDPRPEFIEFSTLTSVSSGDILWVHLYAPSVFQGDQLVGAWNYIALR